MKIIVITGPSGSGKTFLSDRLSNLFDNSIVINTDSYYRDNLLIRFLSIFLLDIYDKPLSIMKSEIKKTLKSIDNKDRLISFYDYDFKRKDSSFSKKNINYKGENQFIIIEGIFSHRLELNYHETINILCKEEKDICFKRRLNRDKLERGREFSDVNMKFNKSWYLFYKNIKDYQNKNEVMKLNTLDEISYDKLVFNLQNSNI